MPAKTLIRTVVVCVAVGLAGAGSRAADQKARDRWDNVNIEGSTKWFTLAQLKTNSDVHLMKREPKLALHKFEVTANLHADDRTKLVTFQYFENFGLPVFYVTLNKAGELVTLTNRIASERIDVTTRDAPTATK
jgi:hypothetical protein